MPARDRLPHSNRREFLKSLAAGAAGAMFPGGARLGPDNEAQSLKTLGGQVPDSPARIPPGAVRRGDMIYRRLGRTNLMISEISLGGSPLPDEGLLTRLIERGVNYIDTSDYYENGNCERKAAGLFKRFGRDKIAVHARFHLRGPWTEKSIIASVEGSLRRLETDHADILGIHGVEKPELVTDERVLGAFEKLKGKFRFRGLTCHVNTHAVIPKAVESGLYDMVQMGYNVFDIQETVSDARIFSDYLGESGLRRLIDLCRGRDVGVTAMKVLKIGGRRQDLSAYRPAGTPLIPAMLKWALENEHLAAVVTEILNEREMEEDLGVVGRPLAAAELEGLRAHVASHARGYCHFCGLCEAACPNGVPTASASRRLVYAESYGKIERARAGIAGLRGAFVSCRGCGACERACPYGLPVRERTRRALALA